MTLVDSNTGEIVGRTLAECEAVIEAGMDTVIEVGVALHEIRDGRLYRNTHPTFEAYCAERWALSRQRAHQMIDASIVSTIVDKPLANEAQARAIAPLAKVDPIAANEVINELTAEGEQPTAAKIAEKAKDRLRAIDGGANDTPPEPTVGDLIDWYPSSFAREAACRRSNASMRFATFIDAKAVKDPERMTELVAACPPELRRPAAVLAEQTAHAWAALAESLRATPARLEAL